MTTVDHKLSSQKEAEEAAGITEEAGVNPEERVARLSASIVTKKDISSEIVQSTKQIKGNHQKPQW